MTEIMFIDSPVGKIGVGAQDGFLTKLFFNVAALPEGCILSKKNAVLLETAKQLGEYFSGKRTDFDLPLRLDGSPFQQKVWAELAKIPYGETRSYQDIARAAGNEKASRAVGMANNRNPVSIIIPCHRVIGKNGKLVGYGGGLDVKVALLELERRAIADVG